MRTFAALLVITLLAATPASAGTLTSPPGIPHSADEALAMERAAAPPGIVVLLDEPNALLALARTLERGPADPASLERARFGVAPLALPEATATDAARLLLAREGLDAPPETLAALARIDASPAAPALARAMLATLAMDAAAREALEGTDALSIERGETTLDWSGVHAARLSLLLAIEDLRADAATLPALTLDAAPALALDLAGEGSVHAEDVRFLLDVGGHDVYLNNAGGSRVGGACDLIQAQPGAAVLVDLAGDDAYGDHRGCGANGGGFGGAGFLLDAAGDDRYLALNNGVNGGAGVGVGYLADLAGSDVYDANMTHLQIFQSSNGANGGALIGAVGTLLDLEGDDVYMADGGAANGGALAWGARGLLVDRRGDDVYFSRQMDASNGGSVTYAVGALIDLEGSDLYLARGHGFGANGGGQLSGVGFLFDAAGDDRYEAKVPWSSCNLCMLGSNGGGSEGGFGFLFDQAGDDTYAGGSFGSNGGSFMGGAGHLVDGSGDDTYTALRWGVNGGTYGGGTGLLLDLGGDDRYQADRGGANGASMAGETVVALVVTGIVVDQPTPGAGRLLDLGGSDAYVDAEGGSGTDRTSLAKGGTGTQLDLSG